VNPPRQVGRPRLCSNEVREQVVRLRAEGWSLRKMAAHRNDAGLPTPAAKSCWTQNTVDNLLATRRVREMSLEVEQAHAGVRRAPACSGAR